MIAFPNRCYAYMAFVIIAIGFQLPTGNAFRCYFCNSETDPYCMDTFNSTLQHRLEECNPPYPYNTGIHPTTKYVCRKVKYRKSNNNEVAVSRMCVLDGEQENGPCSSQSLVSYLKVEHCSTCDQDLCNSAPYKTSSFLLTVLSFISPLFVVLLSKYKFLSN